MDRYSEEWVPQEILDLINLETIIEPDKPPVDMAREILMKAAPRAAHSVAWMALHSGQEQIRLRASQYILDGALTDKWATLGGEGDLLMSLVAQLAENDPMPGEIRNT